MSRFLWLPKVSAASTIDAMTNVKVSRGLYKLRFGFANDTPSTSPGGFNFAIYCAETMVGAMFGFNVGATQFGDNVFPLSGQVYLNSNLPVAGQTVWASLEKVGDID